MYVSMYQCHKLHVWSLLLLLLLLLLLFLFLRCLLPPLHLLLITLRVPTVVRPGYLAGPFDFANDDAKR